MAGIKLNPKHIFEVAKHIVHAILNRVSAGNIHKENIDPLVDKGFEIAEIIAGHKLDPKIEETARLFIGGLLQGEHVLNFSEEDLKNIVEKGIDLAIAFHKKEKE